MIHKNTHIIVAMAEDRLIGKDNQMPWHISEDLKLFKRLTVNNTVIMGRKTFESIGKPLPNRENLVISRSAEIEGVTVCRSLEEAIEKAAALGKEIFIIGGATVYTQALPLVEHLHISRVKGRYEGDTFFPEVDFRQWEEADSEDYADFSYVHYIRT